MCAAESAARKIPPLDSPAARRDQCMDLLTARGKARGGGGKACSAFMSSARRLTRALMAVSTFLRAPWGVSLAVKATINARPRPPAASTWSGYHRSSSCGGRGVTAVRQRAGATGSGEAAVLSEPVDVRVEDASKSAAEGVEVSQREVLSREAWMARAEAHRERWGAQARNHDTAECAGRVVKNTNASQRP